MPFGLITSECTRFSRRRVPVFASSLIAGLIRIVISVASIASIAAVGHLVAIEVVLLIRLTDATENDP